MATQTANRGTATRKAAGTAKANAVAKAKAVAPDLSVRLGSTPRTKFRGDPDVFGRLVEDHDRHRALLAMIEETEGKSSDRKRLFKELVRELKAHAAAEEQALWSTVLREPETTDFARHASSEIKDTEDMMADIAARDLAYSGWRGSVSELNADDPTT